ncbi:hypothetical protein POM88_029245 [Heracleum sosnowskyi]|uniref:FLZ-type domain-containing protein n=1 Tax=Heracleum sosnowskyi TaxID=360622 RepID=A0AAD8MHK1_9APIA|nr:hypothetical protein POM88_029245 [Heracleum sosnowskyi]
MVKRTRIGTASTLVDTTVINYVTPQFKYCSAPPPPPPANGVNSSVIQQSSGVERGPVSRPVFSLESLEICDVVRCGSDRMGAFLEQCFRCKSRLLVNKAVYMHSERAFCSLDCQEIQVMVDEAKEKLIGKRKVLD